MDAVVPNSPSYITRGLRYLNPTQDWHWTCTANQVKAHIFQLSSFGAFGAVFWPEAVGDRREHCYFHLQHFFEDIDEALGSALVALQRFCSLFNLATETHQMFPFGNCDGYYGCCYVSSSPYEFSIAIDEAICLGILSLSSHIFLLWQDLEFLSFQFPSIYKTTLSNLKHTDGFPPTIMLWAFMIGGLSRFTTLDDKWLKDSCKNIWTFVTSNRGMSCGVFWSLSCGPVLCTTSRGRRFFHSVLES